MNQKKDNSNVAQDYISNIVRAYQNCLHISQQIKSAYENTLKTKKKSMKNYICQHVESVSEKTLKDKEVEHEKPHTLAIRICNEETEDIQHYQRKSVKKSKEKFNEECHLSRQVNQLNSSELFFFLN